MNYRAAAVILLGSLFSIPAGALAQPVLLWLARSASEPTPSSESNPNSRATEAAPTVGSSSQSELGPESLTRKQRRAERKTQRDESGAVDPCSAEDVSGAAWLDKVNRGLFKAVCSSARWFDDLFGEELLVDDQSRGTYGRFLLGVEYTDKKEIQEVSRFRAKFDLPNAERKISGFIGRGDREELVTENAPRTGSLPNFNSIPGDDEWLIGLGYSPVSGRGTSGWSYDVGADLEFPINWYAKARYKHIFFPTEGSKLSWRPTVFWEHKKGFGTTSRLDWDFLIGEEKLVRWRNIQTVSESDMGVDWYSELTLFRNYERKHAMAYQLAASGETEAEVAFEYVLGRVIYRRQILRDWFFLDIRPGVSYRRDIGDTKREFRPMLAIGTEILFGRKYE